jgi:uncharacterized protein (DUF2252 family)
MPPSKNGRAFRDSAGRREIGRGLREKTPRGDHARWQPDPNRPNPVDILEQSNQGRVAELIPIRYGRMLTDPFAFLRGSAAVMAYDLAPTATSGIRVQVCGDCHLANFGLFATPERNLVFDLNDFDETLPAPWEWDLKRLAASFVVAARVNGMRDSAGMEAVQTLASSYRSHLRQFSEMNVLDVWYSRLDDKTLMDAAPSAEAREYRKKVVEKARASVAEYLFPKITAVKDGRRHLADQPPLVFHDPQRADAESRAQKLLAAYKRSLPTHLHELMDHYRFQDIAFKVVGVGSVGTRCYVVLMMADEDDPLLLQAKEARPSVLEPYAGKSEFPHHGQRVVVGQRLMQSASDMFLGWLTALDGVHYYIRQLRDMKFSVPLERMRPAQLARYADVCGWVLARAHAKGGDAATVSGYLGKSDAFDIALAKFALLYADQTEQDHSALKRAVKSGKVTAIMDTR